MNIIENKLKANLMEYHDIIKKAFLNYWRVYLINGKYESNKFLNLLSAPRDIFIKFCRENKLNYSSVAGIVLEWTVFHFLKAGLSVNEKDKIACVINRYSIPFRWKGKGNKQVNLDIVIKSIKTKKLYYAVEVKTNFEDGFEKFRDEEKSIYHHRQKNFKHFKYYYLSLSLPPRSLRGKFKSDINTLIRRKELYILNENNRDFPGVEKLLKSIVDSISNIK
jgi:hypothetical protein